MEAIRFDFGGPGVGFRRVWYRLFGMREAIKSAARPGGARATACRTQERKRRSCKRCQDLSDRFLHLTANLLLAEFFDPPIFPPGPPRIPPGRPQKPINPIFFDQNFDHFLDSIFARFWIVLGRHVGVMFALFGGQVRPSSVQNASWKVIFIKNVNLR